MKFKKKLISLSIAVAAFCGFYSSKNSVEAAPKIKTSSSQEATKKIKKKIKKNKKNKKTTKIKNKKNKVSATKNFEESIFYVGVDSSDQGVSHNQMSVYFSPLIIEKSNLQNSNFDWEKFNWKDSTVEIVDDKNRALKIKAYIFLADNKLFDSNSIPLFISIKIPSVYELKNKKSEVKNGIKIEKGFKINKNKKYKLRLTDNAGNVVIEKCCVSKLNSELAMEEISKQLKKSLSPGELEKANSFKNFFNMIVLGSRFLR